MIKTKLRNLATAFVAASDRMPNAFVLIAIAMTLANLAAAASIYLHFAVGVFLIIDAALFTLAGCVQMRNSRGLERYRSGATLGVILLAAIAILGTRGLAGFAENSFDISVALMQVGFLFISAYFVHRRRNTDA